MKASKEGHANVVDQVLQYGAQLDMKNNVGDRCTDHFCSLSFIWTHDTVFNFVSAWHDSNDVGG